jgi:hypothetical protein
LVTSILNRAPPDERGIILDPLDPGRFKGTRRGLFDGLNHPSPSVTRITNIIIQFNKNVNISDNFPGIPNSNPALFSAFGFVHRLHVTMIFTDFFNTQYEVFAYPHPSGNIRKTPIWKLEMMADELSFMLFYPTP